MAVAANPGLSRSRTHRIGNPGAASRAVRAARSAADRAEDLQHARVPRSCALRALRQRVDRGGGVESWKAPANAAAPISMPARSARTSIPARRSSVRNRCRRGFLRRTCGTPARSTSRAPPSSARPSPPRPTTRAQGVRRFVQVTSRAAELVDLADAGRARTRTEFFPQADERRSQRLSRDPFHRAGDERPEHAWERRGSGSPIRIRSARRPAICS